MRLLMELYRDSTPDDHAGPVDAFLTGGAHPSLLPSAVFVCERPDGGLAGFLELSVRSYAEGCEGATPYVESWYVEADARGSGIGRALVAAAERWARERGYTEMASDAGLENRASHQAHEAVGFQVVERNVHFRKAL